MEISAIPEVWSWAWIGEKLWDMPGGFGSLIGAAIGLFAVALAAHIGFKHLITSQEHQAELDRQRDDRRRAEDRKIVAVEIQADIVALMSQASHAEWTINTYRTLGKNMTAAAQLPNAALIALEIPQRNAPPGASHRFGLLGPDLCHVVMQAYVMAATIGQIFAGLRARARPGPVDDDFAKSLQDNFAGLVTTCQRADSALAEVTGKHFESPSVIEPPK